MTTRTTITATLTLVALVSACGGDDDQVGEASPATTASVVDTTEPAPEPTVATSTTSPTATTPPTTTEPESAPTTVPPTMTSGDITIEAVADWEGGVGTFEVLEGEELLGCSSGATRHYILRTEFIEDFTCADGPDGALTISPGAAGWYITSSSGDFVGTFGYGPWTGDGSDGIWYQTLTGSLIVGGPSGSPIAPTATVDRLNDRLGDCHDGFGSVNGLYEYATVDGTLLALDLTTGDIEEHGSPPVPCALWLGDESSGQAVAAEPLGATLWFGNLGESFDVEVTYDEPIDLVSRSIRANRVLVSTSAEVQIVDATTGALVGDPVAGSFGTGRQFLANAVSPDETLIAIGSGSATPSSDGRVTVHDAATGSMLFEVATAEPVVSLTFDGDTNQLLALGHDGNIATIDLATESIVAEVDLDALAPFVALGVRPDGLIVAVSAVQAVLLDRNDGVVDTALIPSRAGRIRADGTIVHTWEAAYHIFDTFAI